MNPTSDNTANDEISLLDLLQVVLDNLKLLILVPLAAGLLALGITFLIPPTFTATTKFMPPQQQQSAATAMLQNLGALGGLAGATGALKNPTDQYIALAKSRTVQDALVARFKLGERYEEEFKQDARKQLEKNTAITGGKDGLITIDMDDKEPAVAAQIANAYVEELGKLLNRLAVTEAQQRRVFFEKQLVTAKDNLIKAEVGLKSSGVNSSALKASPQAAVEGLARLKASIAVQEVKLASMRGYLTESSPDFKQAQTELFAFRAQLARAEKEEPVSSSDSDYISRFREFKYNETLFELFAKQYEMARVDESREGAVIQVVDLAVAPERKSKPKKAIIALIVLLSTFVILLVAVVVRRKYSATYEVAGEGDRATHLRGAWRRPPGEA
jgi:tyrosine-protein kinase Etk/Wzc